MGTSAQQDDPKLRLQYYRETGQDDQAKLYEQYLRETGQLTDGPSPLQRRLRAPGGLEREKKNIADINAAERVGLGQYAEAASEIPETVAAGVPGAKLGISAARAALQGRPLADVQREVNAETSDVPYASAAARAIGSLATLPVLPASGAASGAILGGASEALNNDPGSTWGRIPRALAGAGAGAVTGRLLEAGGNALRAKLAGTPTDVVHGLKEQRTLAGSLNYPRAAAEGQRFFADLGDEEALRQAVSGGADHAPVPALTKLLDAPGIKPYADAVRASPRFANADDSVIGSEAFKLMSEAQGKKLTLQGNAGEFKAATDFALQDLRAAKQQLGNAIGEIEPSFPGANTTHRIISGDIKAARDANRMLSKAAPPTGNALDNPAKDPRAWLRDVVPEYSPSEAEAAQQSALGTINDIGQGMSHNPLTAFGSFGRVPRSRAALIRGLDAKVGTTSPQTIRNALMALLSERMP